MSTMSYTFTRPFFPTAAGIFGLQLLIGQCVNQGNSVAWVIRGPPHNGNISIFFHQFHRINLSGGMGRNVLRGPEQLRCLFHIFPYRLPCPVFVRVYRGRKHPTFTRLPFEVWQKSGSGKPACLRFPVFCSVTQKRNLSCPGRKQRMLEIRSPVWSATRMTSLFSGVSAARIRSTSFRKMYSVFIDRIPPTNHIPYSSIQWQLTVAFLQKRHYFLINDCAAFPMHSTDCIKNRPQRRVPAPSPVRHYNRRVSRAQIYHGYLTMNPQPYGFNI